MKSGVQNVSSLCFGDFLLDLLVGLTVENIYMHQQFAVAKSPCLPASDTLL